MKMMKLRKWVCKVFGCKEWGAEWWGPQSHCRRCGKITPYADPKLKLPEYVEPWGGIFVD